MLDSSERTQILTSLVQRNCLQQPRIMCVDELRKLTTRKLEAAVEGKVIIDGKEVTLCVGINDRFPLSLPLVFLQPPDALGLIPHLEEDGYLCYLDSEGLLLDSSRPVEILVEAIERSIVLLQAGVRGDNQWDFMDEFGVYWQKLTSPETSLPAFISADDILRQVITYKEGKSYTLVADSIDTVHAYFNNKGKDLNSLTRHTALYVPLESGTLLVPPHRDRPWNRADIQAIVRQHLSGENLKRLKHHRNRKGKNEELIILGLPRPKGGKTLIGLIFSDIISGHPLVTGNSYDVPLPIRIDRYDSAYLLARGGSDTRLSSTRVLVVGCGSVGSNVVVDLVQAGITRLTLVDPDLFMRENIFRHVLGRKSVSKSKVVALKEEIESKYPYLFITAHETYIEKAIEKEIIKLSDFDLVIFATGNHTVELYLNRLIHQQKDRPIAIFTWLEPYSIGGHALLTRPNQRGCLQCLFTPGSPNDLNYYNQASFAASGQSFAKNDLGCNSSYVSYGALDARKTAEQATRLALNALKADELGNPVLSWKGADNLFINEGFKTSSRYQLTADRLHETKYDYINPICPICGEQN